MKKVFAFLAVTFILSACGGGVNKYKPAIEELSGKWDTATSAVTAFSKMLKTEQSGLMNLSNSMQIDPDAMGKWDEATASKFNNIKAMVQNNSNGMAAITSELDGFMSSWAEKGKKVKALKDGLAAGKLEGDVNAKIAGLTSAVTDATSKLDGWKSQFNKIKDAIANATRMFAEFKTANNL